MGIKLDKWDAETGLRTGGTNSIRTSESAVPFKGNFLSKTYVLKLETEITLFAQVSVYNLKSE